MITPGCFARSLPSFHTLWTRVTALTTPSFFGARLIGKCTLGHSVQAPDTLTDRFDCSEYGITALTPHRIRSLLEEQLDVSLDDRERVVDLVGHRGRETGHDLNGCPSMRQLLELRIPDGDGGERRKRANQFLVVLVKRDDVVVSVERIDQLEDADNVAGGLHERNDKDRSGAIAGLRIDSAIQSVGPVCRNIVGVREAENIAGERNIPGETWLAQREIGRE